jgi:hypothetical protein
MEMTKADAKRLLEIYGKIKYYKIGPYMGLKTYLNYRKFKKETKLRRGKYDEELFLPRCWLLLFPVFPELLLLTTLYATYILAFMWSSLNNHSELVGIYHVVLWFPFMFWGFWLILLVRSGSVLDIIQVEEKLEKIVSAPKI